MNKVIVTKKGDSSFRKGQVVALDRFLTIVGQILSAGGEMPIAELSSESEGRV